MALLTKEEILSYEDLTTETVKVPEWGGEVRVRTMSGQARDVYEQMVFDKGQRDGDTLLHVRSAMAAATIVGENGELLFTKEDVEALSKKSAAALTRVMVAAKRVNGITDEDIEELAKNSDATQPDASTSD